MQEHRRTLAYVTGAAWALQPIYGTSDTAAAFIQDVGVYHRRLHALVDEQFLDRPDVVAIHEQMRGERASE